jgi:hypothetical protein
MPKKKNVQPTPQPKVDWSGSLADFKNVTVNTKPTQTAQPFVGTRTGTQRPNRGPDTGMFAGQSTPLGTAIGLTDTSAKNVAKVIATVATQEIGGAIIGKAIGKAISTVRPMYYGIHGSPTSGLTKLTPQIGKNTESFLNNIEKIGTSSANTPKVFSYKPRVENVLSVTDYASTVGGPGTGSAYVVKTPAKNIMSNIIDTSKAISASDAFAATSLVGEQMSSKAMKVVKEFPLSNYTKRTYDTMEAAWETSQNFSPLAGQINAAIQADKKLQSSVISGIVKGTLRGNSIRKK